MSERFEEVGNISPSEKAEAQKVLGYNYFQNFDAFAADPENQELLLEVFHHGTDRMLRNAAAYDPQNLSHREQALRIFHRLEKFAIPSVLADAAERPREYRDPEEIVREVKSRLSPEQLSAMMKLPPDAYQRAFGNLIAAYLAEEESETFVDIPIEVEDEEQAA